MLQHIIHPLRTALLVSGLAVACAPAGLEGRQSPPADTLDVFFLGNSYVYYNNLADQLGELSRALPGPILRTAHHLHGGFSLVRHLEDGHLPDVLDATAADGEAWDVVIVQDHSRLGVPYADESAGTIGDRAPFFEGAAGVAEMVSDIGAEMVFYMTWAKEDFPGQTEALAAAYEEAGHRHGADVAPVGLAWDRVRSERPDIILFHPDGSHPSPAGTYLNASIFYAQLTGASPMGAPAELHGIEMRTPGVVVSDEVIPLVRLEEDVAAYLQRVAWEIVSASRE